ncbi:DUF1206 domain-containing protein [Persicitalea jodogahamensis]|uniref:DUF1206 domain-containing protein n=1 Tax=Persicitalea jodogahamensis TaxID=402147 RepID=A0A8J3D7Q8_9BACT|nr:DUF1206 domain-containing protein [Persicitalea jodogahamensis]GHB85020.1 hypothetical protein GCM10007390_45360 [Persicitalea jodogahamensis]
MAEASLSSRNKWIERTGQIGLVAIGSVYFLVGTLTFASSIDFSGEGNKGKVSQILQWVQEQAFGQFLLAVITLGLLCYTVWRFIEAILDTDNKGNSLHGLALRASYLSYGVVYGALTYYAARLLLSHSGGSPPSEKDTRETVAQNLLELPYGQWMVGAFALGTAGVGVFQLYLALSGTYRSIIEEKKIDTRAKEILIRSGQIGYVARAIVWLIIGYFLLFSAIRSHSQEANSQTALNYLEYEYGTLTLAIVSLGLVCYGIFQFARAKYQPIVKK